MSCIIYFISMNYTTRHQKYMSAALELAQAVKGTTFPNPAVGALVVAGTVIVGKGATSSCGGPHAEKIALAQAGARAKNATLYVTLEPCCHFGRTPPCTDAIISSGIRSVYISTIDPNPLVCGRGIRHLRKNGIKVHAGFLSEEARVLNEDFFWSITRKTPWVTLKLALTLDGRIADREGNSQWITTPRSRVYVHDLRRRHAAIIVGHKTLIRDNPKLSVRHGRMTSPARIVFSSSPRLPATSYFIKHARDTRSIVVIPGGNKAGITTCANGLELWHTGGPARKTNLASFLHMAYAEGLTSILVEGGSVVASSFLENHCVNKLCLFYGNKLLGKGQEGFSFYKGLTLSRAIELRDRTVHVFGNDIMVSGIPIWPRAGEI
jgi:diaminohydroxyphosphoribosylaminopyrimidine deaminase / 5-amino-6-(5-phosphoribosylamino)uracil reductase